MVFVCPFFQISFLMTPAMSSSALMMSMSPLYWESARNVMGVSLGRCRECVWERWMLSWRGVRCLGEVEDAGEMWIQSWRGVRCLGEVDPVWEMCNMSGRSGRCRGDVESCLGEVCGCGDFRESQPERVVGQWRFGGRAQDLWRSLAEGHNKRDLGAVITVDRAG